MAFAGLLIAGSVDLVASRAAVAEPPEALQIPERLKLRADRQFLDSRRNVTVAEGDVSVQLGSSLLQADRVEFDIGFKTLYARGLYGSPA